MQCHVQFNPMLKIHSDLGSFVFFAPLDQYIGRHIDRYSTNTLPTVGGISVDCLINISQKLRLSVSDVCVVSISSFFGQPQTFLKPLCWDHVPQIQSLSSKTPK